MDDSFAYVVGANMKLKCLTLERIIDAAYFCGIDGTPVSLILVAPPGTGKTWATSALAQTDFVVYLNTVYSPNEHRKLIANAAPRMKLLINDDLALAAGWRPEEFFGTLCMVHDGTLQFTMYKTVEHATTKCSIILCSTTSYYYKHRDTLQAMGFLDRFMPVVIELSQETRRKYQKYEQQTSIFDDSPISRNPEFIDIKSVKSDLLSRKNLNVRWLRGLRRISQYFTEEETAEFIDLVHANEKNERYEI